MSDRRKALQRNSILRVGNDCSFTVTAEIGRGGGTIVYDGYYTDSVKARHNARIRECYPCFLLIDRNENGVLTPCAGQEEQFNSAKREFYDSYIKAINFRNEAALTNSTVNSLDMFEANNTVYNLMATDEGTDYRKYEDRSLQELLKRIRALATLIGKYHDAGRLHLDIKPENMLVLPETDEMVMLFDFDTVTSIEELKAGGLRNLSFSQGFSAPEQIRGKVYNIGPWTDVFSIGAVTFYKLFGRKPTNDECSLFGKIDFSGMKFSNEVYPPKLYKLLHDFFKRTLSVSHTYRIQNTGELLKCLDELIVLSDVSAQFIIDSYSQMPKGFVGRRAELKELDRLLKDKKVVFLSGMGGIGKSALVRHYVDVFKARFNSVSFVRYTENIATSISQDVLINNFSQDNNESTEDFFKRKIDLLKRIGTPDDLVIVDNFDEKDDKDLSVLLSCPVKFVFTTRHKSYGECYDLINITKFQDRSEVEELFYENNDLEYSEEEKETLAEIFNIIDNHTLTVCLIAKLLNKTGKKPATLLEGLLSSKGVAGLNRVGIRSEKDDDVSLKTVSEHLFTLFNMSDFSETENDIICNLATMTGVKISMDLFVTLCNRGEIEEEIFNLIDSGWVEFDRRTRKLTLHQIISDLAITKLTEGHNFDLFLNGVYRYVAKNSGKYVEKRNKQRLVLLILDRIDCDSEAYIKLCYHSERKDIIVKALNLCFEKYRTTSSNLLLKLCIKYIICCLDNPEDADDFVFLILPYACVEDYDTVRSSNIWNENRYFFGESKKTLRCYITCYVAVSSHIIENLYEYRENLVSSEFDKTFLQFKRELIEACVIGTNTSCSVPTGILSIMLRLEKDGMARHVDKPHSLKGWGDTDLDLLAKEYASRICETDDECKVEDVLVEQLGEDNYRNNRLNGFNNHSKYVNELHIKRKGSKYISELRNLYERGLITYEELICRKADTFAIKGSVDKAIELLDREISVAKSDDDFRSLVFMSKKCSLLSDAKRYDDLSDCLYFFFENDFGEGSKDYHSDYCRCAIVQLFHLYIKLSDYDDERDELWKLSEEIFLELDDYFTEIFFFIYDYVYTKKIGCEEIYRLILRVRKKACALFTETDLVSETSELIRELIALNEELNAEAEDFCMYQALNYIALFNIYDDDDLHQHFIVKAEEYYDKMREGDKYTLDKISFAKRRLCKDEAEKKDAISNVDFYSLAEKDIEYCDIRPDDAEAVHRWCEAIKFYLDVKDEKNAYRCIERLNEDAELTIKFDEAPSDEATGAFIDWYFCLNDLFDDQIKESDFERVRFVADVLSDISIFFMRHGMDDDDVEEDDAYESDSALVNRIELEAIKAGLLASMYLHIGDIDKALDWESLEICVLLTDNLSPICAHVKDYSLFDEDYYETVFDIIHSGPLKENIDIEMLSFSKGMLSQIVDRVEESKKEIVSAIINRVENLIGDADLDFE